MISYRSILAAVTLVASLHAQAGPVDQPNKATPGAQRRPFVPSKPIIVPLRQITEVQGAMPAMLSGFGLVVGLDKTGSGSKHTRQTIIEFLRRHRQNPNLEDVAPGATAMVAVQVLMPAFSKLGMPLTVHVSALGDESDLRGGRLLPCQLRGFDGKAYAVAEGPVFVNGFKAASANKKATVKRNHVTAGTITNGGRVVKELGSSFLSEQGHLELRLRSPSVGTSIAAADGINRLLSGTRYNALPIDGFLIRVQMPESLQTESNAIRLLHQIGGVRVPVQNDAKVIINETSGLIIAGENVQISPCVLALSNLTITVVSEDEVVQPLPGISRGTTETVSRSAIDVKRDGGPVKELGGGGATVGELLANLKSLGLDAQELIEVFKHLREMGYLHAELITR